MLVRVRILIVEMYHVILKIPAVKIRSHNINFTLHSLHLVTLSILKLLEVVSQLKKSERTTFMLACHSCHIHYDDNNKVIIQAPPREKKSIIYNLAT